MWVFLAGRPEETDSNGKPEIVLGKDRGVQGVTDPPRGATKRICFNANKNVFSACIHCLYFKFHDACQ